MRIKDYPNAPELTESTAFLIDSLGGGTQSIKSPELAKELNKYLDPTKDLIRNRDVYFDILDEFAEWTDRRTIVRGKNLGSEFTDEQKTSIKDNTFKGMFLGDYWYRDGIRWDITDYNYSYYEYPLNQGVVNYNNNPHLMIMPRNSLYGYQMNSSNTTDGGYFNSLMRSSGLVEALNKVNSMFGNEFLMRRWVCIDNSVSNGNVVSGAWQQLMITPPSIGMIYGFDTKDIYDSDVNQLALFQLLPYLRQYASSSYWLRNVYNATHFRAINNDSRIIAILANTSLGVRPVVAIMGEAIKVS